MGPACQLGKKEKEKEGGLVYWAESRKGRLGLAQEARLGFSDRLDPRLVGPARIAGSGHGPSAPSHSLSYRLGGEMRARGPAFQARSGVDKVGKRAVARLSMIARHGNGFAAAKRRLAQARRAARQGQGGSVARVRGHDHGVALRQWTGVVRARVPGRDIAAAITFTTGLASLV